MRHLRQLRVHQRDAQCSACWQKNTDRPFTYLAGLLQRLEDRPGWLEEFAGYAAARFCPSRTVGLLRDLGCSTPASPADALLEHARWTATSSIGHLARTLESFYVHRWLAMPLNHSEDLDASRRARRIAGVPLPLRPAVAAFAGHQLAVRERAWCAGTRPRSHHTIDLCLCATSATARCSSPSATRRSPAGRASPSATSRTSSPCGQAHGPDD